MSAGRDGAKFERLLGSSNAGLDAAIACTKSKDSMKSFSAASELMDIGTPQARQYLNAA